MTLADALARLTPMLLAGTTHPDYARVVALATLYRRLATGDIEQLLTRFTRREDPAQYAARLQMTVETVSSSWNELRTPFYQIARLRGGTVTRRFDYDANRIAPTEAQRRAARLESVTSQYFNGRPISEYLAEHVVKSVGMSDPNAWLLTEFAPFDFRTQVAQPYPVLLPCEAVIDFTRAAGLVTSMTARFSVTREGVTGSRYTTYLENEALDFWPVLYKDSHPIFTLPEGSTPDGVITDPDNGNRILWQYRILNHGAGQVPAQPVGYVLDEVTDLRTFVSPLQPAVPFLLQMLKVGSENDIVMAQMAFPIRAAYVPPCPGVKDHGGCVNGQAPITMSSCIVCGGLGQLPIPTTAAETITLPMPKDPADVKIKPSELISFIAPPVDAPKLQLEYLESRRALAKEAVLSTPVLSKTTVTQTATERMSQMDQMNVALTPSADQFSTLYIHTATVCASYVDVADGLIVVHQFPADLQLKSLGDLYAERKAALDAGAASSVLEAIDKQIAFKLFADDPEALAKYLVKARFITFMGYTDDQVLKLWVMGGCSNEERLLRTHADSIFGEIELEEPEFYSLAYAAQKPIVEQKVKDVLARQPVATASMGSNFRPLTLPAREPVTS
jgi:hypothetical protein